MALRETIPGNAEKSLAPYQTAILRHLVAPTVARRADIFENRRTFEAVNRRMIELLHLIPHEEWEERVLVGHQFGLDEHSRFFSPIMVIDHVLFAGKTIRAIVHELAQGIVVDHIIQSPFAFPQSRISHAELLTLFSDYTETCMADLEPLVLKADCETTIDHPWYGPFNMKQWHWLLAGHSMIHYRQLKNIKEHLDQKRPHSANF